MDGAGGMVTEPVINRPQMRTAHLSGKPGGIRRDTDAQELMEELKRIPP